MGSRTGSDLQNQALLCFILMSLGVSALGCGPHYEYAIEEFCLAKFRLDMQELDPRHWCSWEDTVDAAPPTGDLHVPPRLWSRRRSWRMTSQRFWLEVFLVLVQQLIRRVRDGGTKTKWNKQCGRNSAAT